MDGGLPISSYSLLRDDGAGGSFTSIYQSQATSLNVTSLQGGKSYGFVVTATNCVGTSPQSPATNFTTQSTTPETPVAPSLVAATNISLSLAWTDLYSSPPVLYYTLQQLIGPSWNTVFNGSAVNFTLTGLSESTVYTFRLSATNIIGTSSYSAIVNHTTAASFATSTADPSLPISAQLCIPQPQMLILIIIHSLNDLFMQLIQVFNDYSC